MDRTIDLQVSGPLDVLPADETLDSAGAPLGITLPPSYRAFVKRYGFGLRTGGFLGPEDFGGAVRTAERTGGQRRAPPG